MDQIILDRIMAFNLVLSTIIFYWAARIYLMPKLKVISAATIFVPILIFHSLRHLGLMFMASGAVYEGMPPQFAYPAGLVTLYQHYWRCLPYMPLGKISRLR